MGRPRKSATADGEVLRNSVDGAELRAYIERVERLNEDIKELSSDRADVYKEIKGAGYDTTTVRAIIKQRGMDPEKRYNMAMLLSQYVSALGDFASTELGQAGVARLHDEAHA